MPAKANNNKSFPYKLYSLLEEANDQGFSDIVSWQPQGKSFIVHQPKVFVQSILPQKFKQTKFKSFLRQLNIYGFTRIQHGPNKGGYAHAHLIQGYPELLNMIKRISAPDANTAKAKDAVNNIGLKPVLSQVRKRGMTPSNQAFQQQQSPIPQNLSNLSNLSDLLKGSVGSVGSLGSLGSLGMGSSHGGNPAMDPSAAPPAGAQNESFDLTSQGMPPLEPPYPASVAAGGPLPAPGSSSNGPPPDQTAFGKPFESLPRQGGGSTLSLLSNMSNISSGTNSALNMTGSELNLFKDVFKPKDLANDVPTLPTSSQQNATFAPAPVPQQNASYPPGSSSNEYISSNGFLERKPGLLEPSTNELLGLVQGEKNEDLNRSESVFPTKLHRMLTDAKRDGFDHIVSWIHGGTAFKVHDVNAFMERIMPIYFDQTKFESFRRQLNLYGFSRCTRGPSRGMYYHEHFVQNDPSLCQMITRPKSVRKRKKPTASKASVPPVEAVAVA